MISTKIFRKLGHSSAAGASLVENLQGQTLVFDNTPSSQSMRMHHAHHHIFVLQRSVLSSYVILSFVLRSWHVVPSSVGNPFS
jgi:hypothetical protein